MREKFRGYYTPTEEEFKTIWDNCVFIFDTNVLLNLYRYTHSTKNEFIQIMKNLSDRIWIPYQVGSEFHNNRLEVVQKQFEIYNKVNNLFDGFIKDAEDLFNSYKKHPFVNCDNLLIKLKNLKNEIKDDIDKCQKSHPDLYSDDNIRNEITFLFNNKVGDQYSEERLTEIYNLGQSRYKKDVPPGYKDIKKSEDERYGDLIVWFQIMDYAKECNKPVLFITDDNKEDWWKIYCGKTIGPRPELVEEFYKKTNNFFYMYKPETFIQHAQKYLNNTTKKLSKAISEIQEIRKIDELLSKKRKTPYLPKIRYKTDREYKLEDLLEKSGIDIWNEEINSLNMRLIKVNEEINILKNLDIQSMDDFKKEETKKKINKLVIARQNINLNITARKIKIAQYRKNSLDFCPRCLEFWDGAFCSKCGYIYMD